MLEILTGAGLAASAGLNAYIPLLTLALLARFTDLVTLPPSWQWLEQSWVIGVLVVLLAIEVVADKIPIVDHANDIIQTVVRPTSGGLTFGAASGSTTVNITDPSDFFRSHVWVPIVAGISVALLVHAGKATARAVVNTTTLGMGAPVMSTIEDGAATVLAFGAILVPVLAILALVTVVIVIWLAMRRRRRRSEAQTAPRDGRSGE